MRADYTDITLVVDRSGSMASIREDAEGGVNTLIAEQAKQPGECRVTLVQFDTEYEFLHQGVKAAECPPYHLVPRGSTAPSRVTDSAFTENQIPGRVTRSKLFNTPTNSMWCH